MTWLERHCREDLYGFGTEGSFAKTGTSKGAPREVLVRNGGLHLSRQRGWTEIHASWNNQEVNIFPTMGSPASKADSWLRCFPVSGGEEPLTAPFLSRPPTSSAFLLYYLAYPIAVTLLSVFISRLWSTEGPGWDFSISCPKDIQLGAERGAWAKARRQENTPVQTTAAREAGVQGKSWRSCVPASLHTRWARAPAPLPPGQAPPALCVLRTMLPLTIATAPAPRAPPRACAQRAPCPAPFSKRSGNFTFHHSALAHSQ